MSDKNKGAEPKNTATPSSQQKNQAISDEDLKKVSGGLRRTPTPEGTDPCMTSF